MPKRFTARRAIIFCLPAVAVVFGFSRYSQHKALSRNLGRIAFALNVGKVPDSLQVESAYVDSWTEYHIVIACRDFSGRTDYLLGGRNWKITDASPPWTYSSSQGSRDLDYTIVREAKWNTDDNVSAAVLFDQDGERFIVEYHAN